MMRVKSVKIDKLQPEMVLAENVYISDTLVARKGKELDEKLIAILKRREVTSVKIAEEILREFAEEKSALREEYVPVKATVDDRLKEAAADNVKQLFNCFASAGEDGEINMTAAYKCVENVEGVVNDLLDVISGDSTGLVHINNLRSFDEYTYHHSLSASVLSLAIGHELGLDEDTLFRLGRCAMLHDIGKQLVPLEIINNPGKLTDEEFEIIKTHSALGAESLKAAGIGDDELWGGVRHHHEKVNGKGYPSGLTGDAIPLFAKIISVSDVFDDITSYRSYRKPMLPCKACEIIVSDINTAFDYDIAKAFLSKLDVYPVNTLLELSDGRFGKVYGTEGSTRLRPTIKIWKSTEILNLSAKCNSEIKITRIVAPEELP